MIYLAFTLGVIDPAFASIGAFILSIGVLVAQGVSLKSDAALRKDIQADISRLSGKIDGLIDEVRRDVTRLRERMAAVEARIRHAEETIIFCRMCNGQQAHNNFQNQPNFSHPHYSGPVEDEKDRTSTV